MKKILGIILLMAIVLTCCMAIFTGCVQAKDYSHTIIFYSSQGDKLQKITQAAINRFEAKYPGWKVDHRNPGGYDQVRDQIKNDFGINQQPDLAYCYADHVALYLQTGKVVNLNNYINSTETVTGKDKDGNDVEYRVGYTAEEVADFLPGYYAEGYASNYANYESYGYTANDMLTLPFVKSTELMYYNKTALDALNLKPATTWDELWEQCAIIRKAYPSATPLGYDSEANWFITMCQQNGWGYTSAQGSNYLFNNADTQAWLTQLSKYYDMGYITTQEDYGGYTSTLFTAGVENGGLVYCIGSSGGASYQDPGTKFSYGITTIPGSKDANGNVHYDAISQGPSLVMLSGGYNLDNASEKEKMTFLFLKELLDPTFQVGFATESGYAPSVYSAYELEAYQEHISDKTKITSVAANVVATMQDRYFTSPAFVGSSVARDAVGQALVLALQGISTPENALKDALKACGVK